VAAYRSLPANTLHWEWKKKKKKPPSIWFFLMFYCLVQCGDIMAIAVYSTLYWSIVIKVQHLQQNAVIQFTNVCGYLSKSGLIHFGMIGAQLYVFAFFTFVVREPVSCFKPIRIKYRFRTFLMKTRQINSLPHHNPPSATSLSQPGSLSALIVAVKLFQTKPLHRPQINVSGIIVFFSPLYPTTVECLLARWGWPLSIC